MPKIRSFLLKREECAKELVKSGSFSLESLLWVKLKLELPTLDGDEEAASLLLFWPRLVQSRPAIGCRFRADISDFYAFKLFIQTRSWIDNDNDDNAEAEAEAEAEAIGNEIN